MLSPFSSGLDERLRGGEVLIGTFLNLGSCVAAEICASAGFDWVVVDLEHGSGSEACLLSQLQAVAGTGVSGMVRVESHDRSRIGHALDAGAAGIVAPRVDSPEQARLVVAGTRYPPDGTRGVALMNRAAGFGTGGAAALARAGEHIVTVLQVESAAALGALDEIASVRGADVLFVGPADLSYSLGIFGRLSDPVFVDALRAVAKVAENHGKVAGVLAGTPEEAEGYLEEGYRFVGIGGDGGFLAKGATAAAAELRDRVSIAERAGKEQRS